MSNKKKRKICVVVNSRANYSRIKSFLFAVKKNKCLKLQLLVGASALLYRFGEVIKIIKKDGFKIDAMVNSIIEGENPSTMAKSTGLSIIELSTLFLNLKPDIVLTVADRFETMATAIAASYMNIPLAHTQGGEETGSIDESVRHAITKLSHIHFPSTLKAKRTLIKLGENPKKIFMTGCPSIDLISNSKNKLDNTLFKSKMIGVGDQIDLKKKFIVLVQHPVTTEYGSGLDQITITLRAINRLPKNIQTIILWPNVDAGSEDISKGLRIFRENKISRTCRFVRNLPPELFLSLLKKCSVIVGNSSVGIRESSFLGIPSVNIGSRQDNREKGKNVITVPHDENKILIAIKNQLNKKKYKRSNLYGDGNAGAKIAKILSEVDLSIKKRLYF